MTVNVWREHDFIDSIYFILNCTFVWKLQWCAEIVASDELKKIQYRVLFGLKIFLKNLEKIIQIHDLKSSILSYNFLVYTHK